MFKRSSFCKIDTPMCVEVDADYRRAEACSFGDCVEVKTGDTVGVRNSAVPDLVVTFTHAEWRAFVQGVRRGEFDLP